MKWIGQLIYDQIARFRDDIYLEGVSTSTETDVLVVDSNNKVSKRAASGFTSGTATLASTVTVTDSTANTAFPVVFHDESNALLDDTGAFTYNPSTGTLITPNLTVSGTTTTINTTNLNVEDKNIILNYNDSSDTSGTADGAGITIQDAVDASNNASLTWTAADDTFEFSHAVEINNGASGGTSALIIDNDDIDQIALDIDAANTTANVLDISTTALTTGNAINIDCNSLTSGSALVIDVDDALTVTNTKSLAKINYDKSGVIGLGNTATITGLEIALNDDATNHSLAGSNLNGIDVKIDYDNATGAQRSVGVKIEVAKDGVIDGNNGRGTGWETTVNDNGLDFKCYSSANDHVLTGDFSSWQTGADGATTITTHDHSGTAAHFEIEADGNITLDSAAAINLEAVGLIKTTGAGVEIENTSSTGAPALLIDNDDTDQNALKIEASNQTGNVIDITANSMSTGEIISIATDSPNSSLFIDSDVSDTGDFNNVEGILYIDHDKSGVTGDGNTMAITGIRTYLTDAATNHANSTVNQYGQIMSVTSANAQGTILNKGLWIAEVSGGDTNVGIDLTVQDGGLDFVNYSSADSNDYFSIQTIASGATTLTTVDGGATAAHFEIAADGDITLDAAGNINLEPDAGTSRIVYANTRSLQVGLGNNASTTVYAAASAHDTVGALLVVEAGFPTAGTTNNIAGGNLELRSGKGKGTGVGGDIIFKTAPPGSSGSSLNSNIERMSISGTAPNSLVTISGGTSAASGDSSTLQLKNTDNDNKPSRIEFVKDKGAAGADGDDIGYILFNADNAAQELTDFASIAGDIVTAADTDEAGRLELKTAASNGTTSSLVNFITGTGHGTNNIVDVSIGYGATSTTTTAGNLTVTNDLTVSGGNATINGGDTTDAILKLATNTASASDDVIIELVTDEDGTPRQARIGVDHSDNTLKLVHGSGFSGGTNGICVDSSGNVGLGTASPEAHLHLESAGDTAIIVRADVGNSGEDDNPLIHLQQDFVAAGASGVMVDGKLGIVGTAGQIMSSSIANSTYITAQGGGSSPNVSMQFGTGGNNGQDTDHAAVLPTARMTILHGGNIGIGVNDPDSLLEIFGTSTQLKLSHNANDYATLGTGSNGDLTITTVDAASSNAHFEVAADGNIILDAALDIALESGGGDVTSDAQNFTISSSTSHKPVLKLQGKADDTTSPILVFDKNRFLGSEEAVVADDDVIGTIQFTGTNDNMQLVQYGEIMSQISESSQGNEAGRLTLSVNADSTTTQSPGLILEGEHATSGEVDVTIANGTGSTTTIAGTLTMGSTATLDNSGNLLTNAATATALTSGDKTIQGNLRIGGASDTSNNWITIDAQNGTDTTGGGICFYETGTDTIGAPQYGAKIVYNEDDDEFAIGTMQNSVFQRQIYMKRAHDYVYFADAAFVEGTTPTLALSDTSTTVADTDVVGTIYWTNADDGSTTARIQAVATEDHASGANGGTKIEFKTTPNTTSTEATALTIGQDQSLTVAGSLNVNGETSTFTNSGAGYPNIILETTNTGVSSSGHLMFKKDAADTEDGELLGYISFYGEDEGNNQTLFGAISANISESDETDEAGKLTLGVAASDGTNTALYHGLILEGEHASDPIQVDATIAYGAASTTTVAGILDVSASGYIKGQLLHVNLAKSYILMYMNTQNYWYSNAGYSTTTGSTAAIASHSNFTYSAQGAHVGYTAQRACKVKQITWSWRMSSSYFGASDDMALEFGVLKWTPGDDSSSSVAVTDMTITNHDGNYRENKIYTKTWTVTDNADAALAAGDCFNIFARTTNQGTGGATVRTYWYGNTTAEIEIT